MEDIRLAIGLVAFVSCAVFAAVFRLLRTRSKMFLDCAAIIILLLIGVYVRTVWGQLWIVNWIPLPSVIVLSNWFPVLLAALAATVWLRLAPASVGRRMPVMIMMVVAAGYSVLHFIPTSSPECGNKWTATGNPAIWPVCLQTTPHTCSAAAAATILNALGIKSTEQEMAELCLTRSGTTWLGLYHGLATKLLGTRLKVEFFQGQTSDLPSLSLDHPLLLCCELEPEMAQAAPNYVRDGGWIPGLAHSVVYFGAMNKRHLIGDPTRGYEVWTDEDLKTLWTGTGLKITSPLVTESANPSRQSRIGNGSTHVGR